MLLVRCAEFSGQQGGVLFHDPGQSGQGLRGHAVGGAADPEGSDDLATPAKDGRGGAGAGLALLAEIECIAIRARLIEGSW